MFLKIERKKIKIVNKGWLHSKLGMWEKGIIEQENLKWLLKMQATGEHYEEVKRCGENENLMWI